MDSQLSSILQKNPNVIPIWVISKQIKLKKHKFLINKDLTWGDFIFRGIRKNIEEKNKNNKDISLFVFINNKILPKNTSLIGEIYNEYKSIDKFLYVTVLQENTFG
jgi:hypothetical protein